MNIGQAFHLIRKIWIPAEVKFLVECTVDQRPDRIVRIDQFYEDYVRYSTLSIDENKVLTSRVKPYLEFSDLFQVVGVSVKPPTVSPRLGPSVNGFTREIPRVYKLILDVEYTGVGHETPRR